MILEPMNGRSLAEGLLEAGRDPQRAPVASGLVEVGSGRADMPSRTASAGLDAVGSESNFLLTEAGASIVTLQASRESVPRLHANPAS